MQKIDKSYALFIKIVVIEAEVQSSLSRQFSSPAIKRPDTVKRTQSNLQQDRLARSEQA